MRREELYLADLIDNARAVRGYLDGVTRERWDACELDRAVCLFGLAGSTRACIQVRLRVP